MGTPPAGEPTQERVMYYSASWQLLEERITDDLLVEAPAEPEVNRHMQYIWGNRYIDDIALRRQNHNFGNDSPDVTYEDTRYHLTDALFSTVVITNHAGAVSERVSYSPYGKARHHRTADLNGNGGVDSADQLLLFNAWGDGFFADLNRDGTVDSADLLILSTNWGAAESPGRLSVTDNTIGFAGYVFNAEFDDAGLYTVRYRPYDPELGRWLSRDPLGYVDGMGVYEYVRGNPTFYVDMFGLASLPHLMPPAGPQVMPPAPPPLSNPLMPHPNPLLDPNWRPGHRPLQPGVRPQTPSRPPGYRSPHVRPQSKPPSRIGHPITIAALACLWVGKEWWEQREENRRMEEWLRQPLPDAGRKKEKFKCSIKPRGFCPPGCLKRFVASGPTPEAATALVRGMCYAAGCHRPPAPYNCDCGHLGCWTYK